MVGKMRKTEYSSNLLRFRGVIHGGRDDGFSTLDDMYELNMTTLTWTRLQGNGARSRGHSLTRISSKHLLPIGGYHGFGLGVSNKVWVFDSSDSSWREEEALPEEFGEGLDSHQAVAAKTEKGIAVVCLGGRVDHDEHPDKMIIFDIE